LRSAPECFPCSIRQALRTARIAGLDETAQKKVLGKAMRILAGIDHGASPAVIATKAIRAGEGLYGEGDPFDRIKEKTTAEALAMYEAIMPDMLSGLSGMSPVERIRHCAKLAAAGNVIDFGVGSEFDLEGTLRETLAGELAVDDSPRLYESIISSDDFLLISDNAGEIVFDRFLIEEILRLGKKVYVGVKSGGILNDATRQDAARGGIKSPVEIIETGSSSLGIIPEECSQEFKDLLRRAGVVLSKGQANYETLDEAARSVFFILRAKCPIVAQQMGVSPGDSVLMWNHG
jgi:uncharacterized protein with ATP-grasp and redox domains